MRWALAVALLLMAQPIARAQERPDEHSGVRHVFDATPQWEAGVTLTPITLRAPEGLVLCRQGRIAPIDGLRDAHMGCWPAPSVGGESVLEVPLGPGYFAVHRGSDVTWVGGGATELRAGDSVRVDFDDHFPLRVAGWITAGVGVVAGAVLLMVAAIGGAVRTELAITGAAIAGAGLIVGIAMACVNDGIQLTVIPPPERPVVVP